MNSGNYKGAFLFLSSKTMNYVNAPEEIQVNPLPSVIIIFDYGLIKGYCYASTAYPIIQINVLLTNECIFHAQALKPERQMNGALKHVIV